ncbi:TPA: phage antirepressor N-terminal domain-containing protein [Serratia fonticola]
MSSIATAVSTINVPFHGSDLYVVSVGNEAYTPMRPIIDGMGLTYQGQADKLKSRFSKGVREIMIPTKGGEQTMLCLALRKLNGWLQTISPNKVKPEIRETVIQYQEECDDVLYEYWTKGQVTNPRKAKKIAAGKITADQQEAIKQLVMNRGKALPKENQAKAIITMWSSLKSHFGCTYKEISENQFTEALSLAARVPLEGEFIARQCALPSEPVRKQFTDDELYDLACLWSVSQIIRSDAKIAKSAMESVESPIARKINTNDAAVEYFSNRARAILVRESQHIAKMANPGLGWKTELNRLNGKGELH